MTLKEIKAMFVVGENWEAVNTYIKKACGPRSVVEVKGSFMTWKNDWLPECRMEFPKASEIIEARPAFLKFNFPARMGLTGHTVTLTKVC